MEGASAYNVESALFSLKKNTLFLLRECIFIFPLVLFFFKLKNSTKKKIGMLYFFYKIL